MFYNIAEYKERCFHVVYVFMIALVPFITSCDKSNTESRLINDFNQDWYFHLDEIDLANTIDFDHSGWRQLNLPHDWSIEGEFSADHPATAGGGALPGGIGWYRKSFALDKSMSGKNAFVQFDGVYMNSEVWINGQYLGKRPFGYISFEYDITPYLKYGEDQNIIAVRVDNSQQPNSRWYSGSGIYRNTRLVLTDGVFIPQWGTYITTPVITPQNAKVEMETEIKNKFSKEVSVEVVSSIYDHKKKKISSVSFNVKVDAKDEIIATQSLEISDPHLWSLDDPYMYQLETQIIYNQDIIDQYVTPFGVRDFSFDQNAGFFLNKESVKIKGVCMHHDLGCLGAAVNMRAIERQLQILQDMGVNAIRTAHNPPTPELLDLCDQMGFLVMDETFDIWSQKKSPFDYSLYWDEWHVKDITDHIKRDRNHPSIIAWSIGNEIVDQWSEEGEEIAIELAGIVKKLDDTRPITAAMNPPDKNGNSIARSGALDLIGYNYHHQMYENHNAEFSDRPFIGTETTSALATRGYYDEKSDTIKRWPIRWDKKFTGGNEGNTVSAYDQVSAPWGSTHEETWDVVKSNDFLSGMFIWTGFDYLGEPTPYEWPSRSSYFGVVDLAGFPKDAYYMYQSEWTNEDVLHLFPHWNWSGVDSVDVWTYFNADEVELFLNDESLGVRQKKANQYHAMWRVAYVPGELKAVSYRAGQRVLEKKVTTTGEPTTIILKPDRFEIDSDGKDLCFVTVEVLDEDGFPSAIADNKMNFTISGEGKIVGVDNGDPTSHLSFKGSSMNLFHGKCLVVVQAGDVAGNIELVAQGEGLPNARLVIGTN